MTESATMAESVVGGWTTFSCDITEEANKAFKTALQGHVGVNYSPVSFASQVVSGMNYSFFCNAKGVYPGATNQAVIIDIYQPLEGDPHIAEIKQIKI